jgi:hypothetical protein
MPTPGLGKVIKIIDSMMVVKTTTSLNVGTNTLLYLNYGASWKRNDIGYFGGFVPNGDAGNTIGGMQLPVTQAVYSAKPMRDNTAIYAAFSNRQDIVSGSATITIYAWYAVVDFEEALNAPDQDTVIPQLTFLADNDLLTGSQDIYISDSETDISVALDEENLAGDISINNSGTGNVIVESSEPFPFGRGGGYAMIKVEPGKLMKLRLVNYTPPGETPPTITMWVAIEGVLVEYTEEM